MYGWRCETHPQPKYTHTRTLCTHFPVVLQITQLTRAQTHADTDTCASLSYLILTMEGQVLYVSTGRDLPSFESDTGQASLDVNINTEDLTAGQFFLSVSYLSRSGPCFYFCTGKFDYFTHTLQRRHLTLRRRIGCCQRGKD